MRCLQKREHSMNMSEIKKSNKNEVVNNTLMLMIFNLARMLFPLIILPYLTRVLTVETFGAIAFTKAIISYLFLIVDFGFMLSATKEVVEALQSKKKIGEIVGNTTVARLFLSIIGLVVMVALTTTVELLDGFLLYMILSYVSVVLSIFFFEFLFRGMSMMHVITYRFITMRTISTSLMFVFVRSDEHILWIPILDILGTVIALLLVYWEMRKLELKVSITNFTDIWRSIKSSSLYFLSQASSLSFSALNTLLLGIMLSAREIAYWSISLQLINAVQGFYTPITSGVYPTMVRTKELRLIKKELMIFMPIIVLGCVTSFVLAPVIIRILTGDEFYGAIFTFRLMIPLLVLAFPAMLFGWPSLGAIGKVKTNTMITVASAIFQIVGLLLLIVLGRFTLINVIWLRVLTEAVMLGLRLMALVKYRHEFADSQS